MRTRSDRGKAVDHIGQVGGDVQLVRLCSRQLAHGEGDYPFLHVERAGCFLQFHHIRSWGLIHVNICEALSHVSHHPAHAGMRIAAVITEQV